MLSGSKALEFLGGQGVTALGNLVLSRRDSLLLDVGSTVPADEVARLRYADLPLSTGLFPSPLLDSALSKMRAVSTSALVRRTLHPLMIPRKSLAEPVTAGSSSAFSADHGGISPVVPRSRKQASMAPLLFCPAGLEEAGMQGRGALFVGLRWLRLLRWQAKGYQVEVLLAEFRLCGWWGLPVSAWEALASYWSRVLGAVSPEGRYRIPFKDSPPSLACTPLSFPTYQAGSPRSLALRQAAEQMLSRDTLDIIFDPSSGFSSCLFLVGKVTVSWRLVFDLSYLNEFVLQPPFMMGTVASVLPRGGFPSFHRPN